MRIEQLEYLLTLKETSSLSKTAERYFITHQAVSKSLKSLEKEFSVILFHRSSTGVVFTPAGDRFCQFAQKTLKEKQLLEKDLAQYITQKTPQLYGELKIYAVARYITPAFLTFVENFQNIFPQININLHTIGAENISKIDIHYSNTLILLTASPDEKTLSSLPLEIEQFIADNNSNYHILDAQELFACVHMKSPLAKQEKFSDQVAFSSPYVSFSYPFRSQLNDIYGNTYAENFTLNSFDQQKQLIKKGEYFGRYSQHEFQAFFSKNYKLIPFENPPYLLFLALYHPQTSNSPISIFLKYLSENIIF